MIQVSCFHYYESMTENASVSSYGIDALNKKVREMNEGKKENKKMESLEIYAEISKLSK